MQKHISTYYIQALVSLFFLITLSTTAGFAQTRLPDEYQVKAAYIYNFAKFIEWPKETFSNDEAPLVIGLLGNDPFGPVLERTIEGKTVGGRSLVIRRMSHSDDIKRCHMLFISDSEQLRLSQIFAELDNTQVLTVSETETFTRLGGMINFVVVDKNVRFEINAQAAKKVGLNISSRLLAVAFRLTE